MIKQLLKDSRQRPDLFQFIGPLGETDLDKWLKDRHYVVPCDLRELWRDTGGGDMFETETILAPFGSVELGDDVASVNAFHHGKGMPSHYVIFHTGIGGLSAFNSESQRYVSLDEHAYCERSHYPSLDDWYMQLVRAEYAARYGLR